MSLVIKARLNSNGVIQPTQALIVKGQSAATINKIADVADVDVQVDTSGATLVWNTDTDKWEAKVMQLDDISGALDGGEF